MFNKDKISVVFTEDTNEGFSEIESENMDIEEFLTYLSCLLKSNKRLVIQDIDIENSTIYFISPETDKYRKIEDEIGDIKSLLLDYMMGITI